MGRLTDILATGGFGGNSFQAAWNSTPAADDNAPLPPGEYVATAERGELKTSAHGTPGYCVTFRVLEGPHTGRKLWLDCWLTPAALAMTKRDLVKLGIESSEQFESPLPPGRRCKLRVALRRDDDGNERNRISRFEVLGIDAPTVDPFAPQEEGGDNVPF